MLLFDKSATRRKIFVHIDTQYVESSIRICGVTLANPWEFTHAFDAPRRPEINQHHFALVVVPQQRLAIETDQAD